MLETQVVDDDDHAPARLRDELVLWRHTLPAAQDTMNNHLFIYWSHIFVLHAKGYFDGIEYPLEGSVSRAGWERYSTRLAQTKQALLQTLPSHYELVSQIRGPDAAEPTPAEPQLLDIPFTPRGAFLKPTVPLPG